MKKIKIIKIVSILMFLICVVAVPVVCSFIPYQEPILIEESFEVVPISDSQVVVVGELKNPTIVKIYELELHIEFYDENEDYISTKTVTIKQDFNAFSTTEFAEYFTIGSREWNAEYYMCGDIYYTYTKLSWYLYFMMGLVAYFIFTLFFSKQKYYFEKDGKNFEVFVSSYKVVIVMDGQIVAEQGIRTAFSSITTFQDGESQLAVDVRKPIISLCFKVEIKYAGEKIEPTEVKQHSFLKVIDKKKEENNLPA